MRQVILTLATFATLSACLLAVVLVGCEKKQEVDQLVITDFRNPLNAIVDTNERTYLYDHDPCPPCPDTVYKYKVKVVEYQMPPGRWVTSEFICYWCDFSKGLETWPDSVFILSPGEE